MTSRSRGDGVEREPQQGPAGAAVLKLRRPPSAPDGLQTLPSAEQADNLSGQTHKTVGCNCEKNIGSTWLWALFVFGSGYATPILFLNGFRQVKFLPRSLVISAKHLIGSWRKNKWNNRNYKICWIGFFFFEREHSGSYSQLRFSLLMVDCVQMRH